jgi:hypothetical protein
VITIPQPLVSEQTPTRAGSRCSHDGPKWDGRCGNCLDEQIESRAQAVFRFGVLPEDELAEEWAG